MRSLPFNDGRVARRGFLLLLMQACAYCSPLPSEQRLLGVVYVKFVYHTRLLQARSQPADYLAIHDDQGRIMVLICHNTDLSDGWEEEGISPWFFTNFSEKFSYPMGINIVFYALTH